MLIGSASPRSAKDDDRGFGPTLLSEQGSEVGVGRDHNPILDSWPIEDLLVVSALQAVLAGRGSRRALLCTSPRRAREPDCCRPETSSGLAKRKLTLADRLGSVVQSLADIVGLEVREGFQDLSGGHAVAIIATTVATGILSPRRQATPPI